MGSICGGHGVVNIVDRTTSREILSHKLEMGSPIFIEQAGCFFEDYKLSVETLESNLCSELRLCNKSSNNKLRAVKIISKSCLPAVVIDEKLVHTIINRVKALKSSQILKLYKTYESQDCYYVICEYLKHGSLIDTLEDSLFSENRAKSLTRQFLEMSLFLAEVNFFQYNLNPENVFLNESSIKVNLFSAKWLLEDQCWLRSKKKKEDQSHEVLRILFFVFTGKALKNIQDANKDTCWKELSDDCKDFINLLLTKKQEMRQLLQHPWITGN